MSIVEQHRYIEEVAAYIRVSTQEQKLHGISLEAQEKKLREYAEEHGMKIVEWYKDEGVSGRKLIKKRPELQRMIQDAEKRKFKRIIFIKLDRFFRSVAEYHECMKRLSTGGVIWTATEEKYDLSTASGEAFVNMKLTMAQFEADQTGERIRMINEYKVQTGQPLSGTQSLPFCYEVRQPEGGERHKSIGKRDEQIMNDLIDYFMTHHSVRGGLLYINKKYNRSFGYNAIMGALTNEMICGSYKGNPNYCEPYITREEFDKLQQSIKRNPRTSQNEHVYIFTGLIQCPGCVRRLSGAHVRNRVGKQKKEYIYYGYRCQKYNQSHGCTLGTVIFEKRIEGEVIAYLDRLLAGQEDAEARLNITAIESEAERIGKYDIEALQQELSRLNYSWQKGRIKTVEEYDRRYDELMEQIEAANKELSSLNDGPDFEKIRAILCEGWKEMYMALDLEHKRAFWRSFVEVIEIEWTKETKRVTNIKFF